VHRISAKQTQRLALAGIWGTGIVTVIILLVIVIYVLVKGLPDIGWSFLTSPPRGGLSGEEGIATAQVPAFPAT